MSKYVHAQKLNRRVVFQRKQPPLQDTFGQPVDDWVTVFERWANVLTITGGGFINQEFQAGGKEVSRPTKSVRIRAWTLPDSAVTADMRCLIGGVVHEIRVVLPDEQDKRYVDIGVAEGANNG